MCNSTTQWTIACQALLLCPWDFPGKNTEVGCHFLLQGSSQPRDQTWVSSIAARFFTVGATREDCQIISGLNEHRYFLRHALWTILQTSYNSETYKLVNPKGNQPKIFVGRTDVDAEAPILWPPDVKNWLWVWKGSGKTLILGKTAEGEGDNKGRDGWMASLTQWTWVWASSRRLWRTRKPGMLHSMGFETVGHDWATEQVWQQA